jgi:hypothetical protein
MTTMTQPNRPPKPPEFIYDFHVMWVTLEWLTHHCVIPDGFAKGEPYVPADWQTWYFANFYSVKPGARLLMNGRPVTKLGAPAFRFRRAQVVMPQKAGKGPMTAAHCCVEAVGPALFAGWAEGGETYRCADHECPCGWVYTYELGEPMGLPWDTPLIQITAYSQEQADNVYGALRPMIDAGPLSNVVPKTGEEFIRLPGGGRIDVVTSSNRSRLGQRVTFVPQDETGIWLTANRMQEVADTQRRGAAGMGGRTAETTNAWDPAERSVAQTTYEAAERAGLATDIFRLHREAPKTLSYKNKEERRRIHRHVYRGSWWVDLDSIEAEAVELLGRDPGQAERFFGNRVVAGLGAWMDEGLWEKRRGIGQLIVPPDGTEVAGGFDGSDSDDCTAIRLETQSGYRFTPTYGPDKRPTIWDPKEWNGRIPRGEVHAAMADITKRYRLKRFYCDPRDWQSEIEAWAKLYGEEVVTEWHTYRVIPMHQALERSIIDLRTGASTHDGCPITKMHVDNARKVAHPGERYILGKPDRYRKIDAAMADTLCHEAASDWRAEVPKVPARNISHAAYGFA